MNLSVKQSIAARLEAIFGIVFAGILALLPVHAFISTWAGTSIGPLLVWKSWKEILLALLVPLVVSYCVLRPQVAGVLWSRSINKLIAGYVVLHLVLAFFAQASGEAVLAGLLMNLRFLALFVLGQIILESGHPWAQKLKAGAPLWLLWTVIGLAIVAILQVTVLPKDFLTHFGYDKDTTIAPLVLVDDNPDALRAFGTMRGPNTLGAYILLPLAVALLYLFKKRYLLLSTTAGVFGFGALILTGSRSAWIGFGVMVVVLGFLHLPRQKLGRWLKQGVVPAVLLLGAFLWASITIPAVRLAVFHSSPGDPYLLEGSTEKHWQATLAGLKEVAQNPLGTGPGSAGPASFYNNQAPPRISENYFVQIGQEVGIIGLLLFLTISFAVIKLLYHQQAVMGHILLASFIGLSVVCLFLHGWADDPAAMTWWGLAGLFIGKSAQTMNNKGKL